MSREWSFAGARGQITAREWPNGSARYVALLVHGYGEHIGRYEYVAERLVAHGAAVFGPDHQGHGRSEGDRVVIEDYADVVADLHRVDEYARERHPGLPVVLIGHSMGGMIAAAYAQRYRATLAALVLSGPVLGSWREATSLLDLPEIPFSPIDVSTLSRDPEVGERYQADPLVWHGPFKRPLLAALDRCLKQIDSGGRLGDLPTLWVHGEADSLVPLPATRAGVETIRGDDLTERIYPDARHEVFNETNRDEVLTDVTGFIDRVLAR
ncbi:alpha-beta hydrolase superfamily lysophospholipase [Stackebrandtia albiflava]|uniref:Alpha-beta hydrolase superfamily lysophospholipase n=1 Tax=Stackebrandtia albiflava TaxID=406432 RepID=A0A562V2C2_9ACTN|nr:alpha/beta hydrolase [Stackebrandtia albiflava]TWJ12060.1 alpha-beta hydrolase superfamily lysophospholipase [Stackebrandtia albiflava]